MMIFEIETESEYKILKSALKSHMANREKKARDNDFDGRFKANAIVEIEQCLNMLERLCKIGE